ncbi:hypothetical protein [Halorientalis marina]|uniref:hypothetical protein n=1 Tax=Halorientalis marina TaxID=2931976 RepID=UPI001FF505C3|nr:hypothetical protein [Halorientalis marina]
MAAIPAQSVPVSGSLVTFVVSLLVGGLGVYVGASVLADEDDYGHAVVTALVGALVWAIAAALLGWIPLVGPFVGLLAYLAVIKWRYRGGWLTAAGIALVAWIASLAVMSILASAGVGAFDVIGVPGI